MLGTMGLSPPDKFGSLKCQEIYYLTALKTWSPKPVSLSQSEANLYITEILTHYQWSFDLQQIEIIADITQIKMCNANIDGVNILQGSMTSLRIHWKLMAVEMQRIAILQEWVPW